MAAYYNEINPHAAQWLRNLIAARIIPAGDVDTRDIRDVTAADLAGYTQCHFFAGIGLWPYALRLAGWPDERPVETGSCPCQPFSQAGARAGFADERHLWPAWHWLIRQRSPRVIFGEQVGGPHGRMWLDLVSSDLEANGYTIGAVDFPSCGVGAPNIRQRLWWVAHTKGQRRGVDGIFGLAARCGEDTGQSTFSLQAAGHGLGDPGKPGLSDAQPQGVESPRRGCEGRATEQPSGPFDPWREPQWVDCTDGKRRPFEPGSFPLAPRHPGDVAKLRAYGNAINPEVAAEVVRSYLEAA